MADFDIIINITSVNDQVTVNSTTIVEVTPPNPVVATMTNPLEGADVNGTITVSAVASSTVGQIDRVDFLLDGVFLEDEFSAPYEFQWDSTTVADGAHTLEAIAFDDQGNQANELVNFTVTQPTPNVSVVAHINEPPITNQDPQGPTEPFVDGFVFVGTRQLGVVDFPVDQGELIEYFVDGNLVGSRPNHPHLFTWDSTTVANGAHVFETRITLGPDTASHIVNFTVDNSNPNPPTGNDMETPSGQVRVVSSVNAARNAYNQSQPGDAVALDDGTYDFGTWDLNRNGQAGDGDKIFIQAVNPGQATILDSDWEINGEFHYVTGLRFNTSRIYINRADNNRVTDCEFFGTQSPGAGGEIKPEFIDIEESSDCRVSYCEFRNWNEKGVSIRPDAANTTSAQRGLTNTQNNRIDHCYFHDFPLRNGSAVNGTEPIQSGVSTKHAFVPTFTLIEHNLFEDAVRDPEVISLKSSHNTVQFCTFTYVADERLCSMTFRQGERNTLYGCWFRNMGVRTFGNNHRIISNRFTDNRELRVNAGDGEAENAPPGSPNPLPPGANQPTAKRTDVVDNTVANGSRIDIGNTSNGSQDAEDTYIFGNVGPIDFGNHTGTTSTSPYNAANANNDALPLITPTQLTANDVGPRTF